MKLVDRKGPFDEAECIQKVATHIKRALPKKRSYSEYFGSYFPAFGPVSRISKIRTTKTP